MEDPRRLKSTALEIVFLHFRVGWGCEKEKEMSPELLTGRIFGARKTEKKGNGKQCSLEADTTRASHSANWYFATQAVWTRLQSPPASGFSGSFLASLSPSYCFALTPGTLPLTLS